MRLAALMRRSRTWLPPTIGLTCPRSASPGLPFGPAPATPTDRSPLIQPTGFYEHKNFEYCILIELTAGLRFGDCRGRSSDAAGPRSEVAGVCRGQGVARWKSSAGGCRGELYYWPDTHPRARD